MGRAHDEAVSAEIARNLGADRVCIHCAEVIVEDGDSNWTHVSDGARFCDRGEETPARMAEPARTPEFRLCILIDVDDCATLEDAYRKVYRAMGESSLSNDWESADTDWFEDGAPLSEDRISSARMSVIDSETKDGD
jgi:hypothetical protein